MFTLKTDKGPWSHTAQREVSMEEDMHIARGKVIQDSSLDIEERKLSSGSRELTPSPPCLPDTVNIEDLSNVRLKDSFTSEAGAAEFFSHDDLLGFPGTNNEHSAIEKKRKSKVIFDCDQSNDLYDIHQHSAAIKQIIVAQPEDGGVEPIYHCGERGRPGGKKVILSPDEREEQDPGHGHSAEVHTQHFEFESLKKPTVCTKSAYASYGNPEELFQCAELYNLSKKKQAESPDKQTFDNVSQGIILQQHQKKLNIDNKGKFSLDVIKMLGKGGQGCCWLTEDRVTGFMCCVKEVPLEEFNKNEVILTASVNHPNIVKLYGLAHEGPQVYILLEFIDGYSLSQIIAKSRKLDCWMWMALTFFKQLMEVLAHLKQQGILHEDIKGDNIMVGKHNTIHLIDFGLAVKLEGHNTGKGKAAKGTAMYLSPEKASEQGHHHASDMWAATGVLAHMLSGDHPWHSRGWKELEIYLFMIGFYVAQGVKPPPLDELPTEIPELVTQLVKGGWILDPEERMSTTSMLSHPALALLDNCNKDNFVPMLNNYQQMDFSDVDRRLACPSDVNMHADARHTVRHSGEHTCEPLEQDSLDCVESLLGAKLKHTHI